MRLIDADILEKAIDNERQILIEEKRFGAEHILVHHGRRLVEEAPVVNAIPVEWLLYQKANSIHKWDVDFYEAIETVLREWNKED